MVYCARTKQCLDGRVRLKIAEELGIKDIPKIFIGSLSDAERIDVRLVLNGLRRQLTRDQLQTVIAWAIRKNPDQPDRQIGRQVGAHHATVGKVRKSLESVGQIIQQPTRRGANGKMYRAKKPLVFTARAAASNEVVRALGVLGDSAPTGVVSVRKLRQLAMRKTREDELKGSGPTLPDHFDLRCCDFRNLEVEDEVADLMVLDPPWLTEKHLRQPFAETVYRVLKPGGFCLIYTGHVALLDFADLLRGVGLTYRWLISCVNGDEGGEVRNNGSVYTCSRIVSVYQKGGNGRTPSLYRDVLKTPTREKDYHRWQQPVTESIEFVKSFTRPGQLIVDLTMGSGTVAEAVARVGGGRRFLGCEVDPKLVALGKRRVAAALL